MDVKRLLAPFEFIGMTIAAHAAGNPFQEPNLAADMRTVACGTV
jgi:hypothetical protein